jgi:hypothetical protein
MMGWSLAATFAVAALASLAPSAPPQPVRDTIHMGVASCFGSQCHSRRAATGSQVRQNEVMVWQDDASATGAHSRAYATLLEPRSREIALRLGIGPAQDAVECLACHSDAVPASRRGEQFQISDGVTCESCHGGAEIWLSTHYSGAIAAEELNRQGMVATWSPATRATVCLSCHLGSGAQGRLVTHGMMAAGHPRISFELDLFTALQRHHDEDGDYDERKGVQGGARVWAIGQAMAMRRTLDLFEAEGRGGGLFPELVFFDCHACHRPISDEPDFRPTAQSNPARPLDPGAPQFNDANLIMLAAAARVLAPDLAPRLEAEGRALHLAVSGDVAGLRTVSMRLGGLIDELGARFEAAPSDRATTLALLRGLVTGSLSARYTEYAAAEQAVMAVDTLLGALESAAHITPEAAAAMRDPIESAYAAVRGPDSYDPARFRAALQTIERQMAAL